MGDESEHFVEGALLDSDAEECEEIEEEENEDLVITLEDLEDISISDVEDLFNKSTASFRCLAQVLISRSSLLREIFYWFPEPTDPGIDEAINYVEPEMTYDDIGCEEYKKLCKDANIVPMRRVLTCLSTKELNLKYYGLSEQQVRAICGTMMLNAHIEHLILEDNFLTPEAAFWVGEMLRENNCVKILNLRQCNINAKCMQNIFEGLNVNQAVKELDLSHNKLGDEGLQILIAAIQQNQQIQKLNLSHNLLEENSAKILGVFLAQNMGLDFLDLSWNFINSDPGVKALCTGLIENKSIKYLNLCWNGIGTENATIQIGKYIRDTENLEHLDLSHNRFNESLLDTLRTRLLKNKSLESVNFSSNLMSPDQVLQFAAALISCPQLKYMDLENIFANKRFIPLWKRIDKMGKRIRIQGIIGNYRIKGPNVAKLMFDRCKFLSQKPKKKKKKRNFGHFIYKMPDEPMDKKVFAKSIRKFKLKFDPNLVEALAKQYKIGANVDTKKMKEQYLILYPDTEPPPPEPPKKKKGKGKKGKKKPNEEVTEQEKTVTVAAEAREGAQDEQHAATPQEATTETQDMTPDTEIGTELQVITSHERAEEMDQMSAAQKSIMQSETMAKKVTVEATADHDHDHDEHRRITRVDSKKKESFKPHSVSFQQVSAEENN